MPRFNQTILAGNLTRSPELRTTGEGKSVASFVVAVNGTKEGETLFMRCVAFEKTADRAAKYLKKGDPVLVSGRLRESAWETEGQKHKQVSLTVEKLQFLRSPAPGESGLEEEGADPDPFVGEVAGDVP